jgi:hypothetical protein
MTEQEENYHRYMSQLSDLNFVDPTNYILYITDFYYKIDMNRLQDNNRKIELNTNTFNLIYPYVYFINQGKYEEINYLSLMLDYNLFRSGSDYQKKYLKYKQKYLKYKQKYLS